MKTDPRYLKSGVCQPKRHASSQRYTLVPGFAMVSAHQSPKTSWRAHPRVRNGCSERLVIEGKIASSDALKRQRLVHLEPLPSDEGDQPSEDCMGLHAMGLASHVLPVEILSQVSFRRGHFFARDHALPDQPLDLFSKFVRG